MRHTARPLPGVRWAGRVRRISKEAKAERWKAVRLALAIVVFAMVVMLLVVWAFMREEERPDGASGGGNPPPVLPSIVV